MLKKIKQIISWYWYTEPELRKELKKLKKEYERGEIEDWLYEIEYENLYRKYGHT